MNANSTVHVGTSGWTYNDKEKTIFPARVKSPERLSWYARSLSSVEINSTFYHFPRLETIQKWKNETPDDFRFSIKLNKYFTHTLLLSLSDEDEKKLNEFIVSLETLGEKMGVLLVQLPPRCSVEPQKLEHFIAVLRGRVQCAFEFRHESWYCDEIYAIIQRTRQLLVINDAPNTWPSERRVFCGSAYIRLHGHEKLYASRYTKQQLTEWSNWIKRNVQKEVWIYCNNTIAGVGFFNACELRALLTY